MPLIFNLLVEGEPSKFPSRTEFQWKADFSMLVVGNEDGSVEIYNGAGGKFISIGVIVAHKKSIQRQFGSSRLSARSKRLQGPRHSGRCSNQTL